jgi:hypothetical protein
MTYQVKSVKYDSLQKSAKLYSFDFEGLLYGNEANEFLDFIILHKDYFRLFDIKYIETLISY